MTVPIYFFLLIQLVFVTITDLKYRKIRNFWALLNFGISFVFYSLLPDLYPFKIDSFQFSMVFLLVGFVLFVFRVMGGGDSKYLASFFLIVPERIQEYLFYYLLITTIIVGIFFLLKNIIHNREELFQSIKNSNLQGVKNCFGTKFAYAPVILVSWMYLGITIFIK